MCETNWLPRDKAGREIIIQVEQQQQPTIKIKEKLTLKIDELDSNCEIIRNEIALACEIASQSNLKNCSR
jgi:hypothetical protein